MMEQTTKRSRWLHAATALLLLTIGATGCGGGTSVGGTYGSAETTTFEGWVAYKDMSDAKAEELFKNALSLDSGFSEAHNGLGWLDFRRADRTALGRI